jgi:undecaprenyl-diphosphatase
MMQFDAELFLEINRALSGALASGFFSAVTYLGDGLVLSALILPALYIFDRRRFRRHALAMVLSIAVSGVLVLVLKVAVDRPRPPDHFRPQGVDVHLPLGAPTDRSFPSGHAQTAFAAAVYLSCLYPGWAPLFLAIACLVGLSRVAIGVHFPLDVLVGALFGTGFSIIGFKVARRRH